MITYPTTLGLRETDQIEDYNIVDMQSSPCININIVPPDICSWIASNGGASSFPGHSALIITLINGYLVEGSLGFTVSAAYILGCIDYYLGDTAGGNSFTGCSY